MVKGLTKLSILVCIILYVTTTLSSLSFSSDGTEKSPDKNNVLFFPFLNESDDPSYQYLDEIIKDTLRIELNETGLVNIVNKEIELINYTRLYFAGKLSRNLISFKTIGRQAKSNIFLFGKYKVDGKDITISLHAVNVYTGQILAEVEKFGKVGVDIFTLIENASKDLAVAVKDFLAPEEPKKIVLTNRQKAGIGLIPIELCLISVGLPLLLYGLVDYTSVMTGNLNTYKDTGKGYQAYLESYQVFVGLFVSGITLLGISIILLPISLALIIAKKRFNPVRLSLYYTSGNYGISFGIPIDLRVNRYIL